MDFDFQTSYANKSNEELLQIILQKDLYQPAAVQAAEKILAARNVTGEERVNAETAIEEKAIEAVKGKEWLQTFGWKADKFVRGYLFPDKRTPAHFIRYFSIAFLAFHLYSFIPYFSYLILLWYTPLWGFIFTAIEVLTFLMIYWLFKLDKKGWVLLLFYFTFTTASSIYSLFTWTPPMFGISMHPDISVYIFRFFISGLVFYFFNRKDVLDTLQVTRQFQKKILLACLIPVILFFLAFILSGLDLSYYFS